MGARNRRFAYAFVESTGAAGGDPKSARGFLWVAAGAVVAAIKSMARTTPGRFIVVRAPWLLKFSFPTESLSPVAIVGRLRLQDQQVIKDFKSKSVSSETTRQRVYQL
jgi:hypothetical protein